MTAHNGHDEKERFRIFSNQGEIKYTKEGEALVCNRGRMLPALAVTRSIGDLVAH